MRQELSEKAKALLAGADWLEEHGWCQNRYTDYAGRYCAMGSVFAASGEWLTYSPFSPFEEGRIQTFNDEPGRTKEEVIAHMRYLATLY